ncbi:MAG: hypothetical protein K5857_05585 [Lachnospiraceae bacterium]|nr:hypothetical protein [Lachnospiraceae bacterium]
MLAVSSKRALTARQALAENEARAVFLSNMSHEIRTPINAVLGMNEMILRECRDRNILGYSEKIESAGQDLLKLVNGLLEFTGTEPGDKTLGKGKKFIAPDANILAVDDTPMNLLSIWSRVRMRYHHRPMKPHIPNFSRKR